MVKIGAELPKLSQKIKPGIRFLGHPVYRGLVVGSVVVVIQNIRGRIMPFGNYVYTF